MAKTPFELHQHGPLIEYAIEANFPVNHVYGARFEYVYKDQDFDIDDVSMASAGKVVINSHATMNGFSLYFQAWWWLMGDDTIIGEPGLQLPPRYKKFGVKPPRNGLMVTAKIERLDMTINSSAGNNFGIGSISCSVCMTPTGGNTTATVFELGVNYWHSKRFRGTFNYLLNNFGGDTAQLTTVRNTLGSSDNEHEFLFRLAVAL
jgi:hypothetical protein